MDLALHGEAVRAAAVDSEALAGEEAAAGASVSAAAALLTSKSKKCSSLILRPFASGVVSAMRRHCAATAFQRAMLAGLRRRFSCWISEK